MKLFGVGSALATCLLLLFSAVPVAVSAADAATTVATPSSSVELPVYGKARRGADETNAGGAVAASRTITENDFRLCNITVIGSRKTYHRPNATLSPAPPLQWRLARQPIRRMIQRRSTRAVDLDVVWDGGRLTVANVPGYDSNATCRNISACVSHMAAWSCAHPAHEPLFLFVRHSPGDPEAAAMTREMWKSAWEAVYSAWDGSAAAAAAPSCRGKIEVQPSSSSSSGRKRGGFVSSHAVRGKSESVLRAVSSSDRGSAWPTLAESRGKLVVAFAREAYGTGPEDAADDPEVEAFVMDHFGAIALRTTSRWTGFYFFSREDVSGNPGAMRAASDTGMIVVAAPDAGYVPGGPHSSSASMEAAALASDSNSDGLVSVDEALSFMSACGRRVPRRVAANTMATLSSGIQPDGARGYPASVAAKMYGIEVPWLANPPPSFGESVAAVREAVACGANVLLCDYPGSSAVRGGSGYFVAFANDAAMACKSGSACTMSDAAVAISLPLDSDDNDDAAAPVVRPTRGENNPRHQGSHYYHGGHRTAKTSSSKIDWTGFK